MRINRFTIEGIFYDGEDEQGIQRASLVWQPEAPVIPQRCEVCHCLCYEAVCSAMCEQLFEIIDKESRNNRHQHE